MICTMATPGSVARWATLAMLRTSIQYSSTSGYKSNFETSPRTMAPSSAATYSYAFVVALALFVPLNAFG